MDHRYYKTSSDCVFVKKFLNEKYIILLLCVDDMLIFCHENDIQILKRELSICNEGFGSCKTNPKHEIYSLQEEWKIGAIPTKIY